MPSTYIVVPGSVTGDLWHVAAAQILSSEYDKAFPSLVAVVAVTASKADDTPQDKARKDDEVQKGRVTFNYLRFVGLRVILLRLSGTNAGTPMIEQILHSQPSAWFDQAYSAQTGEHKDIKEGRLLETLDFDQLMGMNVINVAKADLDHNGNQMDQPFPKLKPFPNTPANNRVLQLKIATTIAMNLLRDPSTRQMRHNFLAKRMYSGSAKGYLPNQQLAEDKYEALNKLVSDMMKTNKCDGVILENYRKGHVNGGTDTSYTMSKSLETLAKANKLGVIAIPATATENGYNEVKSRYNELTAIFDLFNKTRPTSAADGTTAARKWIDTPWPGLDTRAQAYFWNKVAANPVIKGLIGGRSGSLDIAAFCGVKVLFWDEPWIDYACSPLPGPGVKEGDAAEVDNWIQRSANNDMTAIVQVPQCLRSQQLMLLMGTVAPVRTADGKFWGSFKENVTKGDITKYVNGPPGASKLKNWKLQTKIDSTPVSFNDMRKDLERPDLNIQAHVIDDWLRMT